MIPQITPNFTKRANNSAITVRATIFPAFRDAAETGKKEKTGMEAMH